jgi:signal transduction histidine kinase
MLEAGREELMIAVHDEGPGIQEEELQRVFEPFHRLDASRNDGTGGVGLGLTIARQAIAEHAGTLTLSNKPGGGLLAVIRLPRVERSTGQGKPRSGPAATPDKDRHDAST